MLALMSEQNIDAYEYKQKVIDILNSNFGDDYSIEWLDDTHFSLTYREPMYNDAHEIVGKVTTSIPDCVLERHGDDPDRVDVLVSVGRNIYFDRFGKNERSNSN